MLQRCIFRAHREHEFAALASLGTKISKNGCDSWPPLCATAGIQWIPHQLTVDEIIPLIAALSPHERARLLCLIAKPQDDDAALYSATLVYNTEFSSDAEALAWDSEDSENVA